MGVTAPGTSCVMNPTVATRWNQGAIEAAYERWRRDPASVDATWQAFFEGFELAQQRGPTPEDTEATAQTRVVRLIAAYREIGHFQAHLDPLSEGPQGLPKVERDEGEQSDREKRPGMAVRPPGGEVR